MSNKDGGSSVGLVKSMGVSKSGNNWKVETNKGVMNFPKKNFKEMPGLTIGKTYFFMWNWFDVPNSTNAMRIANEWRAVGDKDVDFDSREISPYRDESSQENTQHQQTETHREPAEEVKYRMNPAAEGMIINNSVAITIALLDKPGALTDVVSIKKTIEFWNEYLSNMVITHKLYEPF
jgi:hypothetical protein